MLTDAVPPIAASLVAGAVGMAQTAQLAPNASAVTLSLSGVISGVIAFTVIKVTVRFLERDVQKLNATVEKANDAIAGLAVAVARIEGALDK